MPDELGRKIIPFNDYDSAIFELPGIEDLDLVVSDIWYREQDRFKEFFITKENLRCSYVIGHRHLWLQ
ncbi:MAG: hypothetical protein V1740_08095 [Candidatus Woesearchaeota archaeon]